MFFHVFLRKIITVFLICSLVHNNFLPGYAAGLQKYNNSSCLATPGMGSLLREQGYVSASQQYVYTVLAEKVSLKFAKAVSSLLSGVKDDYTSPDPTQENTFFQRVQASFRKVEALKLNDRAQFQDEDLFSLRGRTPISEDSFDKLRRAYMIVEEKYPGMLGAILSVMDISKIAKFKKDPAYKNINFANHPEASALIAHNKKIFDGLDEELACAVIQTHGFIGQAKRGEVTDEVFKPLLDLAIARKDMFIIHLYELVNVIDTAVVWEGLFTEDFYDWFSHKSLELLTSVMYRGIADGYNASEILAMRSDTILKDKTNQNRYVLERLHGIWPHKSLEEIEQAVSRVFSDQSVMRADFMRLLSRQENSFSLWYPEISLSWIGSFDLQLQFLYLTLKFAYEDVQFGGKPIDINFYELAQAAHRRDEATLAEENREYLSRVIKQMVEYAHKNYKISEQTISLSDEAIRFFSQGFGGLRFEFNARHNTVYVEFDDLAPIGLTHKQAAARKKELELLISEVSSDNPIVSAKKAKNSAPKRIGVFTASFDPIHRAHTYLIKKALEKYKFDEIIVLVSKGHIVKEEFGTDLSDRVFMLEQELRDLPDVSISVTHSGRFVDMSHLVHTMYPEAEYSFIMGFDNFDQMLNMDVSGNTQDDLDMFFSRNRIIVAPRGYNKEADIKRILIERGGQAYEQRISYLGTPRLHRFDSATEVRRRIRDAIPVEGLISTRILRIIKSLKLYLPKVNGLIRAFMNPTINITFINLTSPRHQVITEPQGINALAGDLRSHFGKEVQVSMIDAQYGMSSREIVEQIKTNNADITGFSAHLESHERLYEVLELIKKDPFFKGSNKSIYVGHNLPTNENEEILRRFPFVITIRGEGELAMRQAIRYMKGEISINDISAASYVRNGRIVENDGIPVSAQELGLPSRDQLMRIMEHGGDVMIETSRGCGWGQCSFCFKDPFRAHKWEPFPDDVVVDGFEYLYKNGVRFVGIADSEFLGGGRETMRGIRRAKKLAQMIIDRGINQDAITMKIGFSMRVDSVFDDNDTEDMLKEKFEALKLMKKAGFAMAFLGIESGSEDQLKRFKKGVTKNEIEQAVRIMRDELGYIIVAGMIPFDPYSTFGELLEYVAFVKKIKLADSISYPLNPLRVQPRTDYYNWTLRDGLLGKQKERLYDFESQYQDPKVGRIAGIIEQCAPEIGSVFYVLKYMYLNKLLVNLPTEQDEIAVLKNIFVRYNTMELDFLDALLNSRQTAQELQRVVNNFRKQRFALIAEVEEKIKNSDILDENGTLKTEVENIRPYISSFESNTLPRIHSNIVSVVHKKQSTRAVQTAK